MKKALPPTKYGIIQPVSRHCLRGAEMKRAVFILGAGASASAGLPIQANLFRDYFRSGMTHSDSFRNQLASFFIDFFDVDIQTLDVTTLFPTFEEALGVLELAIEREETFGPNYSLPRLREVREALIYSMGIVIERKPVSHPTTYHRFVQKLFHRGHFLEDEYAFINFNYDVLLDDALMELNYKRTKIMIDYDIHFANEKRKGQSGNFQEWLPVSGKAVKYLKPHGSFNWMHCPTCNSIYILGNEKSQIFKTGYIHQRESCAKDNTPLDCVIEPPSFFKKYKNTYLQNIWNTMTQTLIEADVIIFIGYSLPAADMWIKYVLKRACSGSKKHWIVVNRTNREKKRYLRFLGRIEYLQMSFDTYVRDWTKHHETWK